MQGTRDYRAIRWTIIRGRLAGELLILTAALLASGGPATGAESSEDIPFLGGKLRGGRPGRVSLGVGAFNVIRNDDDSELRNDDISFVGQAEYQIGRTWYGLAPLAGIMANADGGVFGYGAVNLHLTCGNWIVIPSLGLGGYARNNSKNLGGIFQFYASLGVAHEFANRSRLGLHMSHVSNAWIHDPNPGVEAVLVTCSIPIVY